MSPLFTVHPHARGECRLPVQPGREFVGSPPRPWGMRVAALLPFAGLRFTPTPVGNAKPSGLSRSIRSVHPHARGECRVVDNSRLPIIGSPPRPWGMPLRCCAWIPVPRFTPTPVGNARWVVLGHVGCTVHPHARGECRSYTSLTTEAGGSPPRPWGMRFAQDNGPCSWRFTPTPVGNARRSWRNRS